MKFHLVGYLSAIAGGAVLGAVSVFAYYTKPLTDLLLLTTVARSGDEAYVRYRYADYPVAREALLKHIELTQAQDPASLAAAGRSFDLMLTYGRLALAAEKAGEVVEGREFLQRALALPRSDGGTVTEAQVRDAVTKLDADWDGRLKRSGATAAQ